MSEYFSEFSLSMANQGIPSPADTPYETPSFIRSKRPSREPSSSPAPAHAAGDGNDGASDAKSVKIDARRFTPNLHASLVAEILNLRRELESKNGLVENLETSLSVAKAENEDFQIQLAHRATDVRKAHLQVKQMEQGSFEAVEELVRDRNAGKQAIEELRGKLEAAHKKTRMQDEDAARTQGIWENEKESWEKERRQLERRVHVTENRLRTVVEEMSAQQATADAQSAQLEAITDQHGELQDGDFKDSVFKDSGLGNDSDAGSIRSTRRTSHHLLGSPGRDLQTGFSLADELDTMDHEDTDVEEDDTPSPEMRQSNFSVLRHSTQSSMSADKGVLGNAHGDGRHGLGLTTYDVSTTNAGANREHLPSSIPHALSSSPKTKTTRPTYVDTGYQPSPPPSPEKFRRKSSSVTSAPIPTITEPPQTETGPLHHGIDHARALLSSSQESPQAAASASPISPPQTPVVGGGEWKKFTTTDILYTSSYTQTDGMRNSLSSNKLAKQDSLSPPDFVPSIAIHPPASRPSSPRPYALPPGTKNASTQANLMPNYTTSSMQTEEIRVDKRSTFLSPELRARVAALTTLETPSQSAQAIAPPKRSTTGANIARILTKFPSAASTPPVASPLQSPTLPTPELSRDNSSKDLRNLRAIPLPRPVLTPVDLPRDSFDAPPLDGPFNRSSQYGVTRPLRGSSQLAGLDNESDASEDGDGMSDVEQQAQPITMSASRPSIGRFPLSEPPKVVPEDKEPSPEHRPRTADSHLHHHELSATNNRASSHTSKYRHFSTLNSYRHSRSRSPSFDSMISSSYSTQSIGHPPYPIPARSSSRIKQKSRSEGARSPTKKRSATDIFGPNLKYGKGKGKMPASSTSLRKSQSDNAMQRPATPPKTRRRRQSPSLTPVQSMAFDTPDDESNTAGAIMSPLPDNVESLDFGQGPTDLSLNGMDTNRQSEDAFAQETNLVDAIAATMVGEWMWKYIRKRKSFGIGEETADLPQEGQGAFTANTHGTRHRRWVWLSPYERTIMWDNKQPASGSALLGKKGRKYAIGSVLDVEDTNALPKGSSEGAWTRSICILTSERALKFTTFTRKRHIMWMTALSFLAQSDRLPAPLPHVPHMEPIPHKIILPSHEPPSIKPSRSPAFGRSSIRDSVRLAKGQRPQFPRAASHSNAPDVPSKANALVPDMTATDDAQEAADAPAIPRLHSSTNKHNRKRSNTTPRMPQPLTSFCNHSGSIAPSSSIAPAVRIPATSTSTSLRTDVRSSSSKSYSSRPGSMSWGGADGGNFFEAVGTVRMEAFVDPTYHDGVRYVPGPSVAPRRRRGDSNLSISTIERRREGYNPDQEGYDPFHGF